MVAKQYFRVDRRDAAPDDELEAEGDYQANFDDIGRRAGAILEDVRATEFPSKPKRAGSMFVTDDLDCAESYWRTHDKRYLYDVAVDGESITHRGNMNWVDAIGAELRSAILTALNKTRCRELARNYWREVKSEPPCPEFMVGKVRVRQRLKGLSDLKGYIASQVTRYDPKDESSIEELIRQPPGFR